MAKNEPQPWKDEHPWWWMDGHYFYFEYTCEGTRAYVVSEQDGSLHRYRSVATIWYNGSPVSREEFREKCPLFNPDQRIERA
jgi:hypothetical protein